MRGLFLFLSISYKIKLCEICTISLNSSPSIPENLLGISDVVLEPLAISSAESGTPFMLMPQPVAKRQKNGYQSGDTEPAEYKFLLNKRDLCALPCDGKWGRYPGKSAAGNNTITICNNRCFYFFQWWYQTYYCSPEIKYSLDKKFVWARFPC